MDGELLTAVEGIGLEGLRELDLDDDALERLWRHFGTTTAMASHIGCSHSWLGKLLSDRGIRELRQRREYDGVHPLRTGDSVVRKRGGLTIADARAEADDTINRLWAAADAAWDAAEALDTEQDRVHVHVETEVPIGLIAVGDVHLGSSGVNPRTVRALVDSVAEVDGLYTVLNGDLIEGGLPGCPDSLRADQVLKVEWQRRLAANIAERLSGHCIGVTCGQHEFFTQRASEFDFAGYLAKCANAPYLGPGGDFRIDVGGYVYTVAVWHKYQGNSIYDATAGAKRLCAEKGPFDVSIVADRHAPAASEEFRNGDRMRVFLRGGTLKMHDSYAKSLGYMNSAMQFPFVILWPGERKMWRTGDLQEGLEYLAYLRQ